MDNYNNLTIELLVVPAIKIILLVIVGWYINSIAPYPVGSNQNNRECVKYSESNGECYEIFKRLRKYQYNIERQSPLRTVLR